MNRATLGLVVGLVACDPVMGQTEITTGDQIELDDVSAVLLTRAAFDHTAVRSEISAVCDEVSVNPVSPGDLSVYDGMIVSSVDCAVQGVTPVFVAFTSTLTGEEWVMYCSTGFNPDERRIETTCFEITDWN